MAAEVSGAGRAPSGPRPAVAALAAALLALASMPGAGRAQADAPRTVLTVRAGASSPKSDLGDVADDGQLLSLALGYRLLPRLTLSLEGTLQNLEQGGDPDLLGGTAGPDVELWHYMGVASLELTDPVRSRWEIVLHGGAGGTRVESSGTERLAPLSADELTVLAAVDGGYDVSERVTLFFRADGYLVLGDHEAPEERFLGKEVVLTHTGGLRVRF